MRQTTLLLSALMLGLCACQPDDASSTPEPAAPTTATPAAYASVARSPEAKRIQASVVALADDAMEGRETGTAGFDRAAEYVAERYRNIGLQPAGDGDSYFQRVPLLKASLQRDGARLLVKRDGHDIELTFKQEFLPVANFDMPEFSVEAPAVFVGQAVHAPGLDQDDFAGLDLDGKIAVLLTGAPERFDNDRRAFYSSSREKLRSVAERGAIGAILVGTAEDEARSPWARGAENWARPTMRLRDTDDKPIDSFPQLRGVARVSAAAADALFAGGDRSAAQLFTAAKSGTLKGFALPGTVLITGKARIEPVLSRNVVGRIQGSDPTLSAEHIVYTAHLDHVGIGAPVKDDKGIEDRIYNGALDNALGVAIMLEAAQQLEAATTKPKRSLLFIALTGEEKGLLGAEWFARKPTVARESLVANINMDMPILTAPTTDVVPIGVEHSTLKATLDAAARDVGVALSPDPFPEESIFVRSDQYAFIRAGIPAVYLAGGVVAADKTRDPKIAMRYFLRNCYHQPCDDPSLPIQYDDAARLARLNARIGQLLGDAPQRPQWNKDDFFGMQFAKPPATNNP